MSDADHRETSVPVQAKGAANPAPSSAHDGVPATEAMDAEVARLISNFAPLPSVLGVTFSMI